MTPNREARPLVTCVVPVYNGELFLAETIRSILDQTYRHIEIIVVDDGSTDGTGKILAAHEKLVTVASGPHKGLADARNRGVLAARGEYVAFLDADDLWEPAKIATQLAHFANRPDLEVSLAAIQNFWMIGLADDAALHEAHRFARPLPGYSCCSLLARRPVFDRVGPFADLWLVEDVDWFLRARELGVVMELLPDVLVKRRLHGQNASLVHRKSIPPALVELASRTIARRRALSLEGPPFAS